MNKWSLFKGLPGIALIAVLCLFVVVSVTNVKASQQSVISVGTASGLIGTTTEVEVSFENAADMVGGSFVISYNPLLVTPLDVEIDEDIPLDQDNEDTTFVVNLEYGADSLKVAWAGSGEVKLTAPDGPLFRITFDLLKVGQSALEISELELFDEESDLMDSAAEAGNISITDVERNAGSNRYATAVNISNEGWENANTVLLARGDDYADALAGVTLAYELDAPILLTRVDRLDNATKAEIERLDANHVIILGGTSAVSTAVQNTLITEMGLTIERLDGANRFETATMVAARLLEAKGEVEVSTAFIAYSHNFPDALAAASYAAVRGYPILLTRTNSLSDTTNDALIAMGVQNVIVVGANSVIDDTVYGLLPDDGTSQRIGGANRYETSVLLAEQFLPIDEQEIFIATGLGFADAITGAVLAAKLNSGTLLVRGDRLVPNIVVANFTTQRNILKVTIFGGPSAVTEEIENWFKDYLGN